MLILFQWPIEGNNIRAFISNQTVSKPFTKDVIFEAHHKSLRLMMNPLYTVYRRCQQRSPKRTIYFLEAQHLNTNT